MARISGMLFVIFCSLHLCGGMVFANSLKDIVVQPKDGHVKFGEPIKVSVSFENIRSNGFVVRVSPMADGAEVKHVLLTKPRKSSQASGQAEVKFTLRGKRPVHISGLKIGVEDMDRHAEIFSVVLPVDYTYHADTVKPMPPVRLKPAQAYRRSEISVNNPDSHARGTMSRPALPAYKPPALLGNYLKLRPELIAALPVIPPTVNKPSGNMTTKMHVPYINPPPNPPDIDLGWQEAMDNFYGQLEYILKNELIYHTGDEMDWDNFFGERETSVQERVGVYLACLQRLQIIEVGEGGHDE